MRRQRDLLDMFSYKGLAGFAFLMPSCSSHVASEVEAELLVGEAQTHYALTLCQYASIAASCEDVAWQTPGHGRRSHSSQWERTAGLGT